MNRSDYFSLFGYLLIDCLLGVWGFFQIRYFVRRHRRSRWPTAEATIQRGAIGRVGVGKGGTVPASFMGYSFFVGGVRYAGIFAIIGNEAQVSRLHKTLAGASLQVRFDPSDPDTSFLAEYNDSRFEGLTVTQNPDRLSEAPSFDLQDALR